MKITSREKDIINKLNNGWIFITSAQTSDSKALAHLCKGPEVDEIQLALFWRMYNKGIIYQQTGGDFSFVLSNKYLTTSTSKA